MRKYLPLMLVVSLMLMLSACTAGPNPVHVAAEAGNPAGFWHGWWHGVIAPFTFFISLFSDSVNIYEVNNNGNWYDFGFVLGLGIIFGGGGSASTR